MSQPSRETYEGKPTGEDLIAVRARIQASFDKALKAFEENDSFVTVSYATMLPEDEQSSEVCKDCGKTHTEVRTNMDSHNITQKDMMFNALATIENTIEETESLAITMAVGSLLKAHIDKCVTEAQENDMDNNNPLRALMERLMTSKK